jgi:uncharacterized membrane protein
MRKISFWAKHHRFQAITFLVIIKLLLAYIAFYVGSSLLDLDIHIPFFVFGIALFILVMAALIYPSRRFTRLSKNQFYIRQKSCDFIVAACSFLMIGTLVNNNLPLAGTTISLASNVTSIQPTAEEILVSLKYRDKSTLTRQEKRILKEEFKKQLKVYAVAKVTGHTSDAGQAGLIILTIVAALGLLFLVASLACSLSCNGSDAAAVIVGVLGVALIVWGTIALIKRISKGPEKKKEE